MEVRIHAFELISPDGSNIQDFLEFLCENSAEQAHAYFIPTTKKDGFYVGLALEPKDMKSFCKFKISGNAFEVKSEDLEKGTNLADFNFFLIDPCTGRGLYSHYHRSASLREFCSLLQKRWRDYAKSKVAVEMSRLPEGHKKKEEALIKKKYAKSLLYSLIFKPKSFSEKIAQMSRISEIDFTVMSYSVVSADFTPITGDIERVSSGIKFSQNASVQQIKNIINDFVGARNPRSLSVYGEDEDGVDVLYRLYNDVDTFGSFDFDDFAKNLYLDSRDLNASLQSASIVDSIIKIAKSAEVCAMISTEIT